MGISIEEAIKQLTTYSIPCGRYKDAYDMAIETMRKYQKIEEIYKDWFTEKDHTGASAYVRIGELLKDGDDD